MEKEKEKEKEKDEGRGTAVREVLDAVERFRQAQRTLPEGERMAGLLLMQTDGRNGVTETWGNDRAQVVGFLADALASDKDVFDLLLDALVEGVKKGRITSGERLSIAPLRHNKEALS